MNCGGRESGLAGVRPTQAAVLDVVTGAVVAGVTIVFRGRTDDRSHCAQRLVTVPCR